MEDTVSFNRAQAVQEALTKRVKVLWEERNMGPPPPGGVGWQVNSFGATQMIAPPYHDQNRRVEVILVRDGPPIPPPPPSPDPDDTVQSRVRRLQALVKAKGLPGAPAHRVQRVPCVLEKLLIPGIDDSFVDGRSQALTGVGKFRQISNDGRPCFLPEWLGNYDTEADPLPEPEVQKFLARILPIIQADGFAPSQSDDHVLMIQNLILERIDMGMNQVDLYIDKNSGFVNPVPDSAMRATRFVSVCKGCTVKT